MTTALAALCVVALLIALALFALAGVCKHAACLQICGVFASMRASVYVLVHLSCLVAGQSVPGVKGDAKTNARCFSHTHGPPRSVFTPTAGTQVPPHCLPPLLHSILFPRERSLFALCSSLFALRSSLFALRSSLFALFALRASLLALRFSLFSFRFSLPPSPFPLSPPLVETTIHPSTQTPLIRGVAPNGQLLLNTLAGCLHFGTTPSNTGVNQHPRLSMRILRLSPQAIFQLQARLSRFTSF
jgi:hypothetical protein